MARSALLISLALLALLGSAYPAQALDDEAPIDLPGVELEESEEEAAEEEECEETEDVLEECVEVHEEERKVGTNPPEECLLRTARSRVVAYTSRNKLELEVRYSTFAPADATIEYRLGGGKGPLRLDPAKRHLGRTGVLHLVKGLNDAEMEKVEAASRFTVEIQISDAPSACQRFQTGRLTTKRASKHQIVWSQPG